MGRELNYKTQFISFHSKIFFMPYSLHSLPSKKTNPKSSKIDHFFTPKSIRIWSKNRLKMTHFSITSFSRYQCLYCFENFSDSIFWKFSDSLFWLQKFFNFLIQFSDPVSSPKFFLTFWFNFLSKKFFDFAAHFPLQKKFLIFESTFWSLSQLVLPHPSSHIS